MSAETPVATAEGGEQPREPVVGKSRLRDRLDRGLSPYLYIAPFFVIFGIFGLFPMLYTGWVSLHDWPMLGEGAFVGGDNYARLFGDPRFWNALRNTLSIWFLSTLPQLLLALGLAHVLNDRILKFRHGFQLGLLLPNVTSVVAVSIVFQSIFGHHFGLANALFELVGLERIDWQAGVLSSHVAISSMVVWRWTGYNTILYLAGLQAISRDLYEAAAIDGAGRLAQFRYITIPALRPIIIFTVITSTIFGLQIFAEPLLFGSAGSVTGGSDRQFQTIVLYLYEQGFRNFRLGYSATVAWTLVGITAAFAVVNYLVSRRIRQS